MPPPDAVAEPETEPATPSADAQAADAVATEAYEVILQERAGAVPDIDAIATVIHPRITGAFYGVAPHLGIMAAMHVDAMQIA